MISSCSTKALISLIMHTPPTHPTPPQPPCTHRACRYAIPRATSSSNRSALGRSRDANIRSSAAAAATESAAPSRPLCAGGGALSASAGFAAGALCMWRVWRRPVRTASARLPCALRVFGCLKGFGTGGVLRYIEGQKGAGAGGQQAKQGLP